MLHHNDLLRSHSNPAASFLSLSFPLTSDFQNKFISISMSLLALFLLHAKITWRGELRGELLFTVWFIIHHWREVTEVQGMVGPTMADHLSSINMTNVTPPQRWPQVIWSTLILYTYPNNWVIQCSLCFLPKLFCFTFFPSSVPCLIYHLYFI